ncbi:hypothetical protein [Bosea sp. BIWAKO-01]|uniref:hypothetical protein n=1 Tax=Bosea sp. BIWAKO-01 TaxID=506668 RepID=UPI000852AAA3|nr:hypothetical protein [Bosea sp. BIWAKO-01]GAU85532.1 hypothetical protein BIWAKO_05480 [Bosea sp. BIWAKO-01]
MILEMFGPSGAGKTTMVSALTAHLRGLGYVVNPLIGVRAHPLRRGILKCLASARLLRSAGPAAGIADLFRILPPKDRLWFIRLYWHLALLHHEWVAAQTSDAITIFDQGMVQAVASLIMLSGITDRDPVGRALDIVPKPDLLVRFEAPRSLLEERLRDRWRKIGPLQRYLEIDLQGSLAHVDDVDLVSDMVSARALPMIRISSIDAPSRNLSIDRITAEVQARMRPSRVVAEEPAARGYAALSH